MTQAILINPAVDPQRTRSAALAKGVLSIPFSQQYAVPVQYEGEEYLFLVDAATAPLVGLQWELGDFLKEATDSPATIRLPHDGLQVITASHKGTTVSWLAEQD